MKRLHKEIAAHLHQGSGFPTQPSPHSSLATTYSTMASPSKPSKEHDGLLSALNVAIETLNLAKEISSITPAKAVFGSASVLLAMIRVRSLAFRRDEPLIHVYPGLCGQPSGFRRPGAVLRRGVRSSRRRVERQTIGRNRSVGAQGDRETDDVSRTCNTHTGPETYRSVNHRTVANIQGRVIKLGKRNPVSQLFHAKSDKEALAAWRQELNSVLHIFNVRPVRSI